MIQQLKILRALKKMYHTQSGCWLLAFGVSGCMIGILYFIYPPVFMTIDDARLRYVYAGYASGEPAGNYLFCNVMIGSAVAALYRWFPGVPWYTAYQMIVIWFGSSAVGKTIYKLCNKKKVKAGYAVLLHTVSYLVVNVVSTIMMHFEITAAVSGTAAVVLLLGLDEKDGKKILYTEMVLSALCLILTFLISKSNFYAICCYAIAVLFYHFLQAGKTHSKKLLVRLIFFWMPLTAAGVSTAVWCNDMAKVSDGWQDYLSYNKYRVSYWDYPHAAYDEEPELFSSIGWSEEFYDLAEQMYFLDERFDKDSLSAFVEPFSWFKVLSIDEIIQNAKESILELFQKEPVAKFQIYAAEILLFVMIGVYYKDKHGRKNAPVYWFLLCSAGGTALMLMFLAVRGRLPLRAWLSCFLPYSMTVLIQLLRLYRPKKSVREKDEMHSAKKRLMRAVVILTCCFIFLNAFQRGILSGYSYRIRSMNKVFAAEKYCISKKENIYVFDPKCLQNYSALSEYSDRRDRPVNMLIWGSSYVFTPVFYEQLQYLGYESFSTENLFDENVYLLLDEEKAEKSKLLLYLREEYSGFRYRQIYQIIDGCTVYKLYRSQDRRS